MPGTTSAEPPASPIAAPHFARIAALVEVLFVIALGNIAGATIYEAVAPAAIVAGEAGCPATGRRPLFHRPANWCYPFSEPPERGVGGAA